jgi:hypothetical protein
VDLDPQREVGRGDAAAQECQQAVRGGAAHHGGRSGECRGEAWATRRRLEADASKAHGEVDEAVVFERRDGEAANGWRALRTV